MSSRSSGVMKRSEEHTSELQSRFDLVCRHLLEKKQIRIGKRERGALVTTHKISLFEACRDLFDGVDEYAVLCGETSCLAKRNGRLYAWATDPISSGRALAEFYPTAGDSEVLCLGGGGSAVAITVHLLKHSTRSRITVVHRPAGRLAAIRDIHSQLAPAGGVRTGGHSDQP